MAMLHCPLEPQALVVDGPFDPERSLAAFEVLTPSFEGDASPLRHKPSLPEVNSSALWKTKGSLLAKRTINRSVRELVFLLRPDPTFLEREKPLVFHLWTVVFGTPTFRLTCRSDSPSSRKVETLRFNKNAVIIFESAMTKENEAWP